MHLQNMELFGFKSFADKIKVDFESGITTIVGPNGCGKSNIVDAMKWVLGEKQAKNLRGGKMEDIIFSGTEQRKQLSLSEVSVTIDNHDRVLDIDSDSVIVTRRMYRDGESEYMINKSPVRLKDIEKLFLDTGIGKSAYSVMEQGKMDLILSTRAEDRRYIFEEAAGISRYKMQRKESLKKLNETGDNLERINDIIKEIEREKDHKAKQADRTKVYLKLKDELNSCDIKINAIKYYDFLQKQNKLKEDIEKNQKEREKLSARVSSISADNEKDEKRKNDIQHQLFEQEKKLHAFRIRLEDIDQKTDKNRELIKEQEQRKSNIEKKTEERKENLNRLKDEKQKTEQNGIEIRKKIKDDKAKLADFFESRKKNILGINSSRESIDKKKDEIQTLNSTVQELRSELEEVIKKLIDAIEKRKKELSESEEERQLVRSHIDSEIILLGETLIKIRQQAEMNLLEDVKTLVDSIELKKLKDFIQKFESYEDGFRSILFDKTGIHADKERLDSKIYNAVESIDRLRKEIAELEESIDRYQSELENINEMITRIEKDLSRNENESDWIDKHVQSLENQIQDLLKQIDSFNDEKERCDKTIKSLSKEIAEWEKRLIEFNEKSERLLKSISELTEKRKEIDEKISQRKSMSKKDEEDLERIIDRINSLDRSQVEVIFKKNNIEDYLWTEYEKRLTDYPENKVRELDSASLQQTLQSMKKEIQDLGPINNLAIEEYKDLKKRFEYYISQKNDIEKAREDIISVIDDINRTSIEMFIDTFKQIQKNFSEIFRQLFEGGEASLELIDVDNVLESGIDILVRPPGKKLKNINLLSGGERALTAIALLFATYMVKPSPFCFLDEIDAPLDEENIGRFVKMLREFARGTQFIVVTHNKKTMSISESIYGVTMEEPGVSKLVSLKMGKLVNQK